MAGAKVDIGNVEVVSVSDGQGDMSPADVFPASSIDIWRSEYPDLLDDNDLIHPKFGSFALRSGGVLILVDTGLGGPDGTLLTQLADSGIGREAVDLVVLTHIHPDHVGWNLSDGSPTFPNARYLVTRTDWDYWTQPDVRAAAPHVDAQMLPLEGLRVLDLIDGEYDVTDEVKTLPTPGHTPGHISLVVASAGQRGFILGDVAHSPAQAHYTDWSPGFDVDPDESRRTRRRVLDDLEREATLVASGHFPDSGFGRFVRSDGRRIWRPE